MTIILMKASDLSTALLNIYFYHLLWEYAFVLQ